MRKLQTEKRGAAAAILCMAAIMILLQRLPANGAAVISAAPEGLHREIRRGGDNSTPRSAVVSTQTSSARTNSIFERILHDYPIPLPPADGTYSSMIALAQSCLGVPYAAAGTSPETGFDCSGFVSWVANNSGWSGIASGSAGIFAQCVPIAPEEAAPGDMVFFTNTFESPGITHVGLYMGGNTMIHAGMEGINYADLTIPYWQERLYCFGRLSNIAE